MGKGVLHVQEGRGLARDPGALVQGNARRTVDDEAQHGLGSTAHDLHLEQLEALVADHGGQSLLELFSQSHLLPSRSSKKSGPTAHFHTESSELVYSTPASGSQVLPPRPGGRISIGL